MESMFYSTNFILCSFGILIFIIAVMGYFIKIILDKNYQLNNKNNSLNNTLLIINNAIEDNKNTIADLNKKIEFLSDTLLKKNYVIEDNKNTIADLNKKIEFNENTISDLNITNLNRKIEFLSDALLKKNSVIGNNENTIADLNEKYYSTKLACEKYQLMHRTREESLRKIFSSNLDAFPFLAPIMADYLTYDIEILSDRLNWGNSVEREKKVKSIREIRRDASERIAQAKIATYQLEYIKTLYPAIEDILQTDYRELNYKQLDELTGYDPVRGFLSLEEWTELTTTEKNQLALDRYVESRHKSNWQIGRDYELYIGYTYSNRGYKVDYFGSYMKYEDLGRDLICKKQGKIKIIQCKYWSQNKTIHEKHIFQLYGSLICYSIEKSTDISLLEGVFITNIQLSPMANSVANKLNISILENVPIGDFPRIKCNIGKDELDYEQKIYHLPMDQQYDSVKLDKQGEFWAMTVFEAENAGFRRAYKWHNN